MDPVNTNKAAVKEGQLYSEIKTSLSLSLSLSLSVYDERLRQNTVGLEKPNSPAVPVYSKPVRCFLSNSSCVHVRMCGQKLYVLKIH